MGCQVEGGSKERAGSSECGQDRTGHLEQCKAGWERILQVLWSLNQQWLAPVSMSQTFRFAAGLACSLALFACFCLPFAAKTPASLSPAGLCALFHFQLNRIDVTQCSQDTWHCSVWHWQCLQQKGGWGKRRKKRTAKKLFPSAVVPLRLLLLVSDKSEGFWVGFLN